MNIYFYILAAMSVFSLGVDAALHKQTKTRQVSIWVSLIATLINWTLIYMAFMR